MGACLANIRTRTRALAVWSVAVSDRHQLKAPDAPLPSILPTSSLSSLSSLLSLLSLSSPVCSQMLEPPSHLQSTSLTPCPYASSYKVEPPRVHQRLSPGASLSVGPTLFSLRRLPTYRSMPAAASTVICLSSCPDQSRSLTSLTGCTGPGHLLGHHGPGPGCWPASRRCCRYPPSRLGPPKSRARPQPLSPHPPCFSPNSIPNRLPPRISLLH